MKIEELFNEYRAWWSESYIPELSAALIEQDEDPEEVKAAFQENGWMDPFGELVPLTAEDRQVLTALQGRVPPEYSELVEKFGTGSFLVAMEEEPSSHEVLPPARIPAERSALMSWLSADGLSRIKADFCLEPTALTPVLKPDGVCWAVFAQEASHMFVFDHDFEGGYDRLLCGPQTAADFFAGCIARSKKREKRSLV